MCAHILYESTKSSIQPGSDKVCALAAQISILIVYSIQRFGYGTLPDELNGFNVHRLENVMTMAPAFSSAEPENLPVPSPIYLAIHAACAKVARLILSEAAKRMDKIDRDMAESKTLDPGGSSAAMLEHALSTCA
jgi:hypothetical protein